MSDSWAGGWVRFEGESGSEEMGMISDSPGQ